MTLRYELLATDGAARRGRVHARHGSIETPAFMPVGTYGTVKAMTAEELEGLGAEIVLGNTFHLMLRPGADVVAELGGLHRFMHWSRPILTDSGGFQVFSLAKLRKISEEGVKFRSPIDGSEVRLTPEDSMDVQRKLGSDIAMMFDDCTAWPATETQARASMERSMRWARRCHDHYYRDGRDSAPGDLFGIVQGGMYPQLRRESLEALMAIDLPGLAVGGLAVGEPEPERLRVLEELVPHMPTDRPRLPPCCAGSTCSTVSCRLDTHAMATSSPAPASSTSVTPSISGTLGRSTPSVAAIPAATTRGPICAT